MSYNPLAYPFPSASSIMATQLLMNASQAAAAARYESAGKAPPNDESSHCLCPATPGAAAAAAAAASAAGLLSVPRMPTLPEFSAAAAAAAAAAAQGYLPHFGAAEPAAFYNALSQAGGYAPFDPNAFQHYSPYCAPGFPGMDLAGVRRKNATRETTSQLKAWLYEHRKNPYPTKGEKIMLAIITKMTLTQVSTWFANVRRRLKKENKMTWSPKNRSTDGSAAGGSLKSDDEDEADDAATDAAAPDLANAADGDVDIELSDPDVSSDAVDARRDSTASRGVEDSGGGDDDDRNDDGDDMPSRLPRGNGSRTDATPATNSADGAAPAAAGRHEPPRGHSGSALTAQDLHSVVAAAAAVRAKGEVPPPPKGCSGAAAAAAAAPSKPRIWSLADVATSCDNKKTSPRSVATPSGVHRLRPYEDLARSSWPYYPAAHAHLPSSPPGAPPQPLALRLSPSSAVATPCRPPPRLLPYATAAVDGLVHLPSLQPPPRPIASDARSIAPSRGGAETGALRQHGSSSSSSSS